MRKVAETLGESVRIVKVDTEAEPELSSQLQARSFCAAALGSWRGFDAFALPPAPARQIQGLPTLVFVPAAKDKAALVRYACGQQPALG